ncbi:hypothetical protein Tco_1124835 [Tanacetum coccineum]|uniref:Uncharacterized protein n=1 Tax=Tanacetum coccineum TaxID=301880 RepID=A0ABQ5J8Y0_9ASTR
MTTSIHLPQVELTIFDAHMHAFRQQLQSEQKQAIIEKERGLHSCIRTLISPFDDIKVEQGKNKSDEDMIIKRVQPVKKCSLEVHHFKPAPRSMYMYDRIEDKFNCSCILDSYRKGHILLKEAANAEIDRLTESLVVEAQEKNYLAEERLEFDKCSNKIENLSEELHILKDQNGSLQVHLQRYKDKAALLRENCLWWLRRAKVWLKSVIA